MEFRHLDITVISAQDVKNVNTISKMKVYVMVSIAGDFRTVRKTPVDKHGGTSPVWNHSISFSVAEAALAQQPFLSLLFQLKAERFLGDRDIGCVSIPIRELLDTAASSNASAQVVDYQIRKPSGKPTGTLKFSYKFGETFTPPSDKRVNEPVTAYPAAAPPQAVSATPYPPPQAAYPYPYPYQAPPQHAAGYGHPPPPPYAGGYGYPQVQQPKKKKGSKMGLGLGAGLLGGLLIGDMLSDVGDGAAYDAGYDAGFGDADFDF